MSGLHPTYAGRGGSLPSPAIWSRFNGLDPTGYYHFFDDFLSFRLTEAVAANVGTYTSDSGGWVSYEDTGGSIAQLATEIGGVVRLTTDATDNDEVWMMPGSTTSVFGKVDSSNGAMLAFEARVRPSSITTRNIIVGMSEEGLAAADTISDADAIADKDHIGFRSLGGDSNGLDTFFNVAGGGGIVTVQDDVETLVASTWYKVGFLFDPLNHKASQRIKFFVDGDELSSYVTQTQLDGATFPDGEELHFLIGTKNGAAAASAIDIDWVKIAQVRV